MKNNQWEIAFNLEDLLLEKKLGLAKSGFSFKNILTNSLILLFLEIKNEIVSHI